MKRKVIRVINWVGIPTIILLIIYNIISNYSFENSKTAVTVITFIKEPIFGAILGVIITIFILNRWNRIENDISSVQKEQLDALKQIRDDAENIIKGRLDSTTRKANAIESKISGLLEEHPWVSSITENDLIPDAPSCRIVLNTCKHLVKIDRIPLLYEYLYGWVRDKPDDKDIKLKLSGTIDDFLDLADFCERFLGDEYLALQITVEGITRASNKIYGYPNYLKKLVRFGNYEDAKTIAKYINRQIPLSIKFWKTRVLYKPDTSMRASYLFDCYSSLILFYSLSNKPGKIEVLSTMAKFYAKRLNTIEVFKTIQAESHAILGNYSEVNKLLEEVEESFKDSANSEIDIVVQQIIYNVAFVHRTIGNTLKFKKLIQLLNSEKKLDDKEDKINLTETEANINIMETDTPSSSRDFPDIKTDVNTSVNNDKDEFKKI